MYIDRTAFEQYAIAFYNVENLLHPSDERYKPKQNDISGNSKQWTDARYRKKLKKLATVIPKIGKMQTGKPPSLIGLAEVGSDQVLDDLLVQNAIKDIGYGYIHFDSPDERGIDTALLYKQTDFEVLGKKNIPLVIYEKDGRQSPTRDILKVYGKLKNTPLTVYVNHWPSRRDGGKETAYKRISAAEQLMDQIVSESNLKESNLVIMGDFNDDPENESINKGLVERGLQNVTDQLKTRRRGSLNHRFQWNLFDQMFISPALMREHSADLFFYQSDIFDDEMLKQWKGKYRGQPARTFAGGRYKGGLSDHFPIYGIFRYKQGAEK